MVKDGNDYVWKKPDYITIREVLNIISDALDRSYNEHDNGYNG